MSKLPTVTAGKEIILAALRESDQRLRAFINASSSIVYRMSADWSEMLTLQGKDFVSDAEDLSRDWISYVPEDERPRVMDAIHRAMAEKGIYELEHRVYREDGSEGWVFSRALPLLDDAGRVTSWFGTVLDVTERKGTEEALKASEENYRTLFQSIDEGFCTIQLLFDDNARAEDYLFLQVNPSFERHTGIREAEGRRMREIAPLHEEHWFEIYGRVALTGESVRFEQQAKELGGRFYDLYAFRIGQPEDRRVGVLFRDITERKRREANQAFLVNFTDEVGDLWDFGATVSLLSEKIGRHFEVKQCLFGELDEASEVAFVSHSWAAKGAYSLEGGHRLRECLSEEQYHATARGEILVVEDALADCRVDAGLHAERVIHSLILSPVIRDGAWRFLFAICDDKPRRWTAADVDLMRELTTRICIRYERARAKASLRQSEERLRITLESAEMAAWDWDIVTGLIYWNERHFFLLGLVPDGGPKDTSFFFQFVHPEDAPRVGDVLMQAVERNGVFQCEFRITRRDNGEVRWMSGYGRVVESSGGTASRMTGVMYDCTQRKAMEEQVRRAQMELEERVKQRTAELQSTLDRLHEEIASREEIEHSRHELLRRLVTTQEEERHRISRELHDNLGQHMVAVKFGLERVQMEVESGRAPLLPESFDELGHLVGGLIKAVHRQAWELSPPELDHFGLPTALQRYIEDWTRRTGISAEFCHDEGADRLPRQLEVAFYRIVQEALTNAARHAACSQVVVDLTTAEGAEIRIGDDGRGMDAKPRIGSLGLVGMRERMTLVGGTLAMDSSPGRGTRIIARVEDVNAGV